MVSDIIAWITPIACEGPTYTWTGGRHNSRALSYNLTRGRSLRQPQPHRASYVPGCDAEPVEAVRSFALPRPVQRTSTAVAVTSAEPQPHQL